MTSVSELLLNKGEKFYKAGKILIKVLLICLALFVFICLVASYDYDFIEVLALSLDSGFANFLVVVSELGILIGLFGIPLYFFGLQYMGLGQIAKNTDKAVETQEPVPAEAQEPVPAEAPAE